MIESVDPRRSVPPSTKASFRRRVVRRDGAGRRLEESPRFHRRAERIWDPASLSPAKDVTAHRGNSENMKEGSDAGILR
jgi:hypothetical protein